jgi:hypothetical protein
MPTPEPIDATTLRRLADWAHSVRQSDPRARFLVVYPPRHGKRKVKLVEKLKSKHDPRTHIVIPIQNRPQGPRVELTDVELHVPGVGGGKTRKLSQLFPDFPDAVFWTESAVQKFMLPYYASKLGADEHVIARLARLLEAFRAKPDGASSAPADDNEPVALVHLPNSEYTTADTGGGNVGVVVLSRERPEAEPTLKGMTLEEYSDLLRKGDRAEEGIAGQEGA